MAPPFTDHFGGHGADYALARPTYPPALYRWIAAQAPATTRVWDCGTGNGQAAVGLAAHFDEVIATDPSEGQLAAATAHPRVRYQQAPAEDSGLPTAHVDAVTVAEAFHWFDVVPFFEEVRRVVRPGGLVAIWGYRAHFVCPDVDAVHRDFRDLIDPWFPEGRARLDAGYAEDPFPFREIAAPDLAMSQTWKVEDALAYLRTWSAVKRFQSAHGEDPVTRFEGLLHEAWGDAAREVTWPLVWRVGFR